MAAMCPTTHSFDRREALERAAEVFRAQGYQGASIQQLVDQMGINRAGLYAAFGDKHGLFCEVIEHYSSGLLEESQRILRGTGRGLDNLYRYLDFVEKRSLRHPRQGCLINSTAVEVGTGDQSINRRISDMLQSVEGAFLEALRQAVREGDLAPDLDAPALARLLLCFVQGLTVLSKVGMPESYVSDCMRMLRRQIRTLQLSTQ